MGPTKGKGNGNLVIYKGGRTEGILYELTPDQLNDLAKFEIKYRPLNMEVTLRN